MFELKVLVIEFVPPDRGSAGAIAGCEISTLNHKTLDNPVEI